MTCAVQGSDQGRQLRFSDILHLVHEDREDRVGPTRCLSHNLKESLEVLFEITIVGETRLGFQVESDFDVVVLDLEGCDEASKASGSSTSKVTSLLVAGQSEERLPELRGEHCWQRPRFRSLHAHRLNSGRLCVQPHALKQHRLSDTAQSDQKATLGRASDSDPLQGDPDLLAQLVAAC